MKGSLDDTIIRVFIDRDTAPSSLDVEYPNQIQDSGPNTANRERGGREHTKQFVDPRWLRALGNQETMLGRASSFAPRYGMHGVPYLSLILS